MSSLTDHLGDEWGSLLTPVTADLPGTPAVSAPDGPGAAPDAFALIQEVLGRMDEISAGDPAGSVLEEILASEEHFVPLADEPAAYAGSAAPDPFTADA